MTGKSENSSPGRKLPLTLWAFAMMLAVWGGTWAVASIGQAKWYAVAATGLTLSAVLAIVLRMRIASEARKLRGAVLSIPEFETAGDSVSTPVELEDVLDALRRASVRMRSRLQGAEAERMHLAALLDSMQDAVVAVDRAGRIQWTNHAMEGLIPSSGQERVRLGHALVQTVRDPEVLECVKTALEHGAVCERRSTSMLPGRIYEVNASPIAGGGAVVVLHDITRIEQVERTQRDFVANVSHELRTPLTSISGYVETLLDHEELAPIVREFLSTILKNASRMSRLTEDLLTMAGVESGASKLRSTAVPANMLVRDAVDSMRGLVQDEEAELDIGETTGAEVMADADAMLQVLGNLIENGIKYGRPRGGMHSRVVVSAREISEPLPAVEFSVRDFGQGIGSEHLDRIFERFYRVDKARSRESGGTGLGLSIARHIVQMQGGTIHAESELNSGSRFIVTLPKAASLSNVQPD